MTERGRILSWLLKYAFALIRMLSVYAVLAHYYPAMTKFSAISKQRLRLRTKTLSVRTHLGILTKNVYKTCNRINKQALLSVGIAQLVTLVAQRRRGAWRILILT